MRLHCAASPPGAPLIVQGVRIDWPLGEACKIGSTPDSSVIATTPPGAPVLSDVATIIPASPFCKAARLEGGSLGIACCKAPPCPPAPPRAAPPFAPVPPFAPAGPRGAPVSPLRCSSAEPPADAAGADPAPPLAPPPAALPPALAPTGASPEPPFNRAAILCAIGAGSFRNCDVCEICTTTGFFVTRSCTVIVFVAASIELIVPEIFRKEPDTTSSAASSPPSALFCPRARS